MWLRGGGRGEVDGGKGKGKGIEWEVKRGGGNLGNWIWSSLELCIWWLVVTCECSLGWGSLFV